jgi:aspartate aminotransferase-like enzyme
MCRVCAERLQEGVKELGLELFVEDPAARLPTVNTIKVEYPLYQPFITVVEYQLY